MRRNRVWSWVLLWTISLWAAGAQETRPATARHSLWKVSHTNGTSVYLLGSIHVLKAENYPLAEPIEAAFSNAQIVAFEADVQQIQSPETQIAIMTKAMLPEGETLKQQLSPAVYAAYSKHMTDAGLPVETFDTMKPSVAAMMITVMELTKMDLDPEYGVDSHFYKRARAAGKQVAALETVDFQISLITEFSKAEGELLMKMTLDEIDQTKKSYAECLAAWQTGDAVKLEKLLNDVKRQSPALHRRLVTDRNRNWLPKIEEFLRGNKNALVIVGAGHLIGSEGVVDLLQKKGWKVTQL